jgi:hypothetical protein
MFIPPFSIHHECYSSRRKKNHGVLFWQNTTPFYAFCLSWKLIAGLRDANGGLSSLLGLCRPYFFQKPLTVTLSQIIFWIIKKKGGYPHIISKDKDAVMLASLDYGYIAGSIYFLFQKKAYYKYGAYDTEYHDLHPSYLVMWEVIINVSSTGYESLYFGRTEPENIGLL